MYDVFVSYSTKNNYEATEIMTQIERKGKKCFFAPRNIGGGESYPLQIVNAIKECSVVVLIVSRYINESEHILNEVELAVNNKKPILPLKIEDCTYNDSLQYYLNRKQWIDVSRGSVFSHIDEIMSAINAFDKQSGKASGNSASGTRKPLAPKDIALTLSFICVLTGYLLWSILCKSWKISWVLWVAYFGIYFVIEYVKSGKKGKKN